MSTTEANQIPAFAITQEFLETAFGKPVAIFSAKVGTNPGDNYCSILYSIDVTFKGETGQKHYLIKCFPDNPGRRAYLEQANHFKKELFMYADLLPKLDNLIQTEAKTGLGLAPFHGGNVTGSNITTDFKSTPYANENFLIMTDIRKTSGFKMPDRLEGLSLPQVKLVLDEVAKLHAASWAYKQKHNLPLLSSKYPLLIYAMQDKTNLKVMMDAMAKKAINAVEETLGADSPACKNLQEFLATDLLGVINDSLRHDGIDEEKQESLLRVKSQNTTELKEPWLVLAHGDCWGNNLLFRYETDDKPVEVTLIDFQICRESCPTTDLAYLLYLGVRASLRIKHENELLRVYFDAFNKYCDALKVPTLPGFTFENLQRRYRRGKLYGLVLSVLLLPILLKPKENLVDNKEQHKDENSFAVFSSVIKEEAKNTLYQTEMATTVQNLYEEGVI